MAVPILIFLACMAVGAYAAARWLPNLEAGSVGGLAFFAVCGLAGVGLGLVGLHIYGIVKAVEDAERFSKGEIVASGLQSMLFEVGLIFGAATAVYLLAPAPPEPEEG